VSPGGAPPAAPPLAARGDPGTPGGSGPRPPPAPPPAATREEVQATTLAMDALQREREMLQTLARAGALSAAGKDRVVKEYLRAQTGIRGKLEKVLGSDSDSETVDSLSEALDGGSAGAVARLAPPSLRVATLARDLGLSDDLVARIRATGQ